MGDQDTQGM